MSKILKTIPTLIVSIVVLGNLGVIAYKSINAKLREPHSINACDNFDPESFKNTTNCTNDDLNLLVDIGNCNLFRWNRNLNRFIKWESDIKVEVIDIERLGKDKISDIDSIIKLMAPLIAPVKIYRVEKNGNFRTHLDLEDLNTAGCAFIDIYWGNYIMKSADIYVRKWHSPYTLIHEFLHGLGLSHPRKTYPFDLAIDYKRTFNSFEEHEKYLDQKFPFPEQEKRVLKMLYSPIIKSGLTIECFKEKMNME
jgi:hypothetical protein